MTIHRPALRTLAIAILALLAGAAPLPPAKTAPALPESARYTDPTYNFSLAVPTFAPTKERAIIATFQGPSEDGFASNVTLVVDPGATTREEYLKNSMEQLAISNPRYTMRHLDKPQVSGRDAALVEYDFTVGGRRLHFLQLAVFGEDRVYILTCTAPQDTYKNHEAEFRKCVDSFRLEK